MKLKFQFKQKCPVQAAKTEAYYTDTRWNEVAALRANAWTNNSCWIDAQHLVNQIREHHGVLIPCE